MPIVLLRVDERLIHGQVVVGWGNALHPERIVVVDDELADSTWEQELYTLGLPASVSAEFVTAAQARDRLEVWDADPARTVLLTRTIRCMHDLGKGGLLRDRDVNIGGLHHSAERRAVLPYVYLSDAERSDLRDLALQGARVSARDVPGARRVGLEELLDGGA